MKETLRLCLALGLTCLIAGTVLVFAHEKTRAPIEHAELAQKQQALGQVLGEFDNDPFGDRVVLDGIPFYRARNQANQVIAVAGEASPRKDKPFGGKMKVLVGIDQAGTIRCVVVTQHKETPGLGTKVTERQQRRSLWQVLGLAKPTAGDASKSHLDGYTGQAAQEIGTGRTVVDGVTGATISSRAVKDAIQQVCVAFDTNQSALLDQKTEIAQ